jgi:hypothetical protein
MAVDWKKTIQARVDLASRIAIELPRLASRADLTADNAKQMMRVMARCTDEIDKLVRQIRESRVEGDLLAAAVRSLLVHRTSGLAGRRFDEVDEHP